jgi:hypothetical protein
MERNNRVSITQLTEEEGRKMVYFNEGEDCKIPAKTPHYIVNQCKRIVGAVIGMNHRPETRIYDYGIIYRRHSEETVIAYYDILK